MCNFWHDIDENVQYWSKYKVVTPWFHCLKTLIPISWRFDTNLFRIEPDIVLTSLFLVLTIVLSITICFPQLLISFFLALMVVLNIELIIVLSINVCCLTVISLFLALIYLFPERQADTSWKNILCFRMYDLLLIGISVKVTLSAYLPDLNS